MRSRIEQQRGFSLIEVLIALLILGVGMLASITMLDTSFTTGSASKNMTAATGYASYMLDRIRTEAMSPTKTYAADVTLLQSFVMDTGSATGPTSDPGKTAWTEWRQVITDPITGLPGGQGTVQISPLVNQYEVTVRVTWRGILRRGVTLTTILTL